MSLQSNIKHQANIADLSSGEVLEDGYQIEKFVVVSIRKPAADRNRVLGMEDVRGGRVVNDYGILEVATNLREILYSVSLEEDCQVCDAYLDIVALVIIATLAEKTVVNNAVDVQLIKKRIAVLIQR